MLSWFSYILFVIGEKLGLVFMRIYLKVGFGFWGLVFVNGFLLGLDLCVKCSNLLFDFRINNVLFR